ncbi:MAG: ABC transporter permease, partial [Mesorhizobium sp.]
MSRLHRFFCTPEAVAGAVIFATLFAMALT